MRFEDWDVLLFPSGRDSKIPMKEFKVACHVAPDPELSHTHGSVGMPVMTCYVPALSPGTPFHVSIHSWKMPGISQYTRNYSKHPELVKFETRILVDGRLVASTSFDRTGTWPHLIKSTFECNKNGELEPLRFPNGRRELLHHIPWSAADDLGRIKIVISEGFPRDSLSMPIERVKNVVAFSFQHAPLDVLESNGIAWPNLAMWRRPTSNFVPTYHPEDGVDSHLHSPRRRPAQLRCNQGYQQTMLNSSAPAFRASFPYMPAGSSGGSCSYLDPFNPEAAAYGEWVTPLACGQSGDGSFGKSMWSGTTRKYTSTDTSMPDYLSPQSSDPMPQGSDPMHVSGRSLEDDPLSLKVPTNTPTGPRDFNGGQCMMPAMPVHTSTIPPDFATSLTHSLLNQPHPLPVLPHNFPLQSKKEARHLAAFNSYPTSAQSTPFTEHIETRRSSQSGGLLPKSISTSAVFPCGTSIFESPMTASQSTFLDTTPRAFSGVDLGNNTSAGAAGEPPIEASANTPGSTRDSNKSGLKRARTFTPVSARVIDEEDDPHRPSPRARIDQVLPANMSE